MEIVLDPAVDGDLLAHVRRALAEEPERALVVDLRSAAAEPALLRTLRDIADQARAADRAVFLAGVTPQVYKALHVAGLATAFHRT
jgi:anti-anti-sigma regulatory factor